MKEGKISEPAWKRSVLKTIKNRREEILLGAGVSRAGNLLSLQGQLAVSMEAGFLTSLRVGSQISGRILLCRAVNACAAMGAEPVAVQVQLLCPLEFMESDVRQLLAALEEEAERLGISLLPGTVESSEAVSAPYLTLNGIGALRAQQAPGMGLRAGQELVISKWIALEATALLAVERETELLERYTPAFVNHAKELLRYISVVPEAAVAVQHGVKAMLPIEEGGIFGALWELADGAGLGLEVRAKDIPIRQETVEICEQYHKNPYQLPGGGSLLMVTEDGERLKRELARAGIPASVAGRLTEGRERFLWQEDEKRYLELPKKNEWKKSEV